MSQVREGEREADLHGVKYIHQYLKYRRKYLSPCKIQIQIQMKYWSLNMYLKYKYKYVFAFNKFTFNHSHYIYFQS